MAAESVLQRDGFSTVIDQKKAEIQSLYKADQAPWIVGYSGGKDSTAVLQLIWTAIAELPVAERHKTIHVISTDTLVENPIVASWVAVSLERMKVAAEETNLPIVPHRLTPSVEDSFWVNLIGKGYPAPRPKFRWCTFRLKITPSNRFIRDLIKKHGETILALGTRKAESAARSANMSKYEDSERYESLKVRELLSVNGSLPGSWAYTPISDWSNDDVWIYVNQVKNPWGIRNQDLLTMYQGATEDGECPLVVDSSTPSCGDSRFGCYVCTMVEQDKSMAAMIQNDSEKDWMTPLLEYRNKWLLAKGDRKNRDYRRLNGSLTLHNGQLVHGPYKESYRHTLLRELLRAQGDVAAAAPEGFPVPELISIEELQKIREIWVEEKGEIEDVLPEIFQEMTGKEFPSSAPRKARALSGPQLQILRTIVEEEFGDPSLYELTRSLVHTESKFQTMVRRKGVFDAINDDLRRGLFANEEDAEQFKLATNAAHEEQVTIYEPMVEAREGAE